MKRVLICVVLVMLAGGIATAQQQPYTVDYDSNEIVQIDPGYQSMTSIAVLPYFADAIEYSRDGYIYGVSIARDTLIKVDPATGTAEIVGPLGFDFDWGIDLDEDDHGQLWMLASVDGGLYTIDRITGTATLQCQPDFPYLSGLATADGRWLTTMLDWPNPPPDPGCGLEYMYPAGPGPLLHLEAANDGWIYELYPLCLTQFCYYKFSRHNPATGASEFLGEFVYFWGGLSGITLKPSAQPSQSIPALGLPGTAILVFLITTAGSLILRRRS